MSVSGVSSTSGSTATGQLAGSNGVLSATDFYKIITTQLENQDPDNATDTNQMVQEMEGLSNYTAIQSNSLAVNNLSAYETATSLIGKAVSVTVPATTTAPATSTSGTVTDATLSTDSTSGSTTANVTINGAQYPVADITDISDAAASTGTTGTTGN